MRWYERDFDVTLPPERAAAERYMLREFSPKKALVSQRVNALRREAELCAAQGVAVCMNRFEEAASWDFPEEKRALAAMGVAAREFRGLDYPIGKNPTLAEDVSSFAAEVKGGVCNGGT
jgi:benzoyl-CoA reductase/2-hydroxyglutaryl-CoA dehydratase subunit BcrC/BadD/HgdB